MVSRPMVSRPMSAYRQNAPERVNAETRVRKVKEITKLMPQLTTLAVLSAALRTFGG